MTTVTINVYTADDQSVSSPNFAQYGTGYNLTTATFPAGPGQIYIATELAPTATGGATIATPVRLPQLAVSFSELNATATAGTCTDRVIVGYN
jgi:hypothetical protein